MNATEQAEAVVEGLGYRSFAGEVVADSSGQFCGNGLRFATRKEAEFYVADLEWRWIAVRQTRVVESTDPVNSRWSTTDRRVIPVAEEYTKAV